MAIAMMVSAVTAHAADTFQKPTKEELEMKSLAGYPGAAAVVLFREEITKDDMHAVMHYERIKILSEEGKKYANVELGFVSTHDTGGEYSGDDKTLDDIQGRTVHADGTIIPFTGKPYLKTVEKGKTSDIGYAFQQKVFTLPDVEVGSIIEYRYVTRISDSVVESPRWYIQGDLYVKQAHYQWLPTVRPLIDTETSSPINSISWFPILPAGAKIDAHELPVSTPTGNPQRSYELTVRDIPPIIHEEFQPPTASFSYRVLFSFTAYMSAADFWKGTGKSWSKGIDKFAGPNSELTQATQGVIAGATTQEDKLKKIYALVMSLENTRFTRAHESAEDRAEGRKMTNAADVLALKRGSPTQLTELFIGMARAAGMKAYAMYVPDRSQELFTPMWLNLSQFDDVIAIVNIDGKDEFFDPGERYCDFKHLSWQHTFVRGMRQTDGGTDFFLTPGDGYTANRTSRVANLDMDEHGEVTGKIDLTFIGASALSWRQSALRGDREALDHQLRTTLEDMLPASIEVKVGEIENLTDYTQPLKVHYTVKGVPGTPTGKRLMVPADLFLSRERATFPSEKRQQAVYFHYPHVVQDALRIKLPKEYTVEAVPDAAKLSMGTPAIGTYDMSVTHDANSFTMRRNYIFNSVIVLPADYSGLRNFYSQFESKDKETVVLTPANIAPPAAN
jgi:hypothetical protein